MTTNRWRSSRRRAPRSCRPARSDLQFARDEGEGFEWVADWRAAHERFWSEHEITDETLILCEYFRVVRADYRRVTHG